jgi:hypothetical protein
MWRRGTALVLSLLLGPACAVTRQPFSVLGREVTVVPGEGQPKARGELLAIGEDRLWVREPAGVREIPLAAACKAADSSDCAQVGLVVAGIWLAAGGGAAVSLEKSTRMGLSPKEPEKLRPYARYPQGLPAGVDPRELGKEPAGVK